MKIPVVFCSDKNYIAALKVALYSLVHNKSEETEYLIYIIVSGDVDEFTKQELCQIVEDTNCVSPVFLDARIFDDIFDSRWLPEGSQWSKAIYYRLFLHKILPEQIEKCIYLDCDVIVNMPLDEIYSTDLENCLYAGEFDDYMKYVDIHNGMYQQENYVNSGVLLLNLQQWRTEKIEEKIYDLLDRSFPFPDQDILNIIGVDRKIVFPHKKYIEDCPYIRYEEDDPQIIIHFDTGIKPWKYGIKHKYYQDWEKYASMCGLNTIVSSNNYKREFLKTFFENNLKEKVIIWGAMPEAFQVAFVLEQFKIEVLAFGDNNRWKIGKKYDRYPVIGIEQIDYKSDVSYVIIPKCFEIIKKQLIDNRIPDENIFSWKDIKTRCESIIDSGNMKKTAAECPNKPERYAGKYIPINEYVTYIEYLKKCCKPGQYNLLCHRHLGDTLILLGLKDEFEQKYKRPIHYLIQRSQKDLPELYNVENFTAIDFSLFFDESEVTGYSSVELDRYKENLCERMFSAIPQLDDPFITVPTFWTREQNKYRNFIDGWSRQLGLEVERIEAPHIDFILSSYIQNKIDEIGKVEDIVLFAPEAKSYDGLSLDFWNGLADKIRQKGFHIITNAVENEIEISNALYLPMSLKDCLALGSRCHSVYSYRSGLCDCLAGKGENLHVFYSGQIDMKYHMLNDCFKIGSKVDERYISNVEF